MVDGRSIYIDAQGIVFWKAIPVTLPEIKRIEVLKGPASVLYGFNAFDGIINIITKSPEEMRGTTLQFGGGQVGTISSAAIYANTYKNFSYRLSYGHDQNQQWRNHNALAFRDNKFNIQTEYALTSESRLLVSGGLVDANRFDGTIAATALTALEPSLGYAHVVYERPNFFVRAFWNGWSDTEHANAHPLLAGILRFTDQNGSSIPTIRANTYNIEAQHSLEFGRVNRFSYGINYRHNTLSTSFIDQYGKEDRLGVYIQDEWRPVEKLTAVTGIRYDMDTFINPTISPRLSLLYTPVPNHTFRITAAVGYRPPTFYENNLRTINVITFPPPFPSPAPILVQGSRNLQPEQIVSYEASYQGWYLKHRLRAQTAVFFNHISDLINFGAPSPFQASGVADIYGGEAAVDFLVNRWLSGFANFSFEDIHQNLSGDARRGAPRFKWNLGVRGEWENGLSGEAGLYHVGASTYPVNAAFFQFAPFGGFSPPSERVGSYNLLNMRAGYRFWQQKAAAGYMPRRRSGGLGLQCAER